MNKEEKLKQYEQAINYLIDIQAYFEGCEYFTKKLWTKLKIEKIMILVKLKYSLYIYGFIISFLIFGHLHAVVHGLHYGVV